MDNERETGLETQQENFMESPVGETTTLEQDQPIMEGTEQYDEAQAQNEINDISDIDLQTEELPEVDESKLEDRLEYAPHMTPGRSYAFIFALDKGTANKAAQPFQMIEKKGKKYGQANYQLTELREDGSTGKVIKFLRADMYRSPKMDASKMEELLFALGKLHVFQATARKFTDAYNLLQEAEAEQKVVRGVVQWQRSLKKEDGTYDRWSTAPQKPYTKPDGTKVAEKSWPKTKDGKFNPRPEEFAAVNGDKPNYGSETVSRVLPTKETAAEIKAARAQTRGQ